MLLSLFVFFIILSSLILIHEFGHFYVAKKSGVKVYEFGLGLPPKIFGKKIGETEYTLNLLPIGGFVRIEGEDPHDPVKDKKHNFQFKPAKVRLAILLAGVFMNTILGILLFYAFFLFNGFISNPIVEFTDFNFILAKKHRVQTVITGVTKDELKEKITPGDVVVNAYRGKENLTNINEKDLLKSSPAQTVTYLSQLKVKDFQNFVNQSDEPLVLLLYNLQTKRTHQELVTPEYSEKYKRNLIGLGLDSVLFLDYSYGFFPKTFSGLAHAYNILGYSMKAFGELIYKSFAKRDVTIVSSGVSGPVGIYSVVSVVLKSNAPSIFWTLVDLTALLSLSLAFMNLLPIPALDGGRAIFVLYEALTKKKINPKVESWMHRLGMAFLILLLVLITLKDVFVR